MKLVLFENLNEKDKTKAVEKLIIQSTPSQDFYFFISLSVLTAVFGIILKSIPVIIGSMLIAPLLSPVLSLSLGITISDRSLIGRSTKTIFNSLIIGAGVGAIATLLFGGVEIPIEEMIIQPHPTLLYAIVSIVAGLAGAFALVKQKLNESLPGTAIAVALIPPIALIGVGIAKWSWSIIADSFIMFLFNTLGIVFAGMIIFSLTKIYTRKKVIEKTVEEEEKILKKEKYLKEKLE